MSMNKKILLTIVPVFTISIGIYLVFEILRTKSSFQKDFDESVKTSMTILGPALSSNIYNLEKFSAQSSIKGIFANSNILTALSFGDDKNFFAGIKKDGSNKFNEVTGAVDIKNYIHDIDITKQKGFSVTSSTTSPIMRQFIYPLWSKPAEGKPEVFGGLFVIEASTQSLHDRTIQMILRLIIGLTISLFIAVIFTYVFLQFQIIKPIVRLMQASLDIAGGKFTKLPSPKDRNADEIAMLTDNFNFMVNKIELNLILIRGISEASQEIVKCKTFNEIVEICFKHCAKLVHAGQVDIWISSKGQPDEDSKVLKRITDSRLLDTSAPMFAHALEVRDVAILETTLDGDPQKGLCVPLINGRGILVGLVEVYFSGDHKFGEEEIRIANGIGISATTAIENCWRVEEEKDKANMERDLELASAVQDSIVSKIIPKNSNCEVATYYKTAGSCGGDWFGAYEVGINKMLVLFGDVTGHGTPAALITAVTRGSADMLRHFITEKSATEVDTNLPAQALQYLNQCIHGTGRQTYFMTMVAALVDFDTQKIHASSAGHTPPAIISMGENGLPTVKYFYPKVGNRLGFQKDSKYESQEFTFIPGQQVLFYTDGIIEGENKAGKEYGMKKFKQSMEAHGKLYPEDLVKNTSYDAFQYFDGVPPKDDIAMLAIRFLRENEKAERTLAALKAA